MTRPAARLALVLPVLSLAACIETTPGGGGGFLPRPPVHDAGDLRDTRLEAASLTSSAPITPVVDLPLGGSATYRGMVASEIRGDYRGDMVGDLRMNVPFGIASTVTGSIDNVTVLGATNTGGGADLPNQTLTGSLDLDARRLGSAIDGTADGFLRAVDENGRPRSFDVDLNVKGAIRTDWVPADAISGTFDGTGDSIGTLDDMQFRNGVFYAER